MHVVKNINKVNSNKRSMTTVSIEEVDESWALKLLNECELDDEAILVETHEHGNTISKNESYLTSINFQSVSESLIQELIESESKNNIEEYDLTNDSLSAIENQKLALLAKQELETDPEIPEQTSKLRSNFSLTRIKGFFKSNTLDAT